jgi:tetratricopeptide (TPR) repeat protein
MTIPPLYLMIAMGLLVSLNQRPGMADSTSVIQIKKFGVNSLIIITLLFSIALAIFNSILNDLKNAAASTLEALRIKPDFDLGLFNMGYINEREGRRKDALSYYGMAVKSNPEYAEAYFSMGIMYLNEKDLNNARQAFEKALKIKPGISGIHFNLGLVYDNLNLTEKARSEYEIEITKNPKSAVTYSNLGLIYSRDKKWTEAIFYYSRAININPNLGPAQINLASVFYMLGNYDSSWKHSRIAEKLGVSQAREMIRALEKVSKEPE